MQTFIVLGFYLIIFEQKKVEFKRKTNTIENRFDRLRFNAKYEPWGQLKVIIVDWFQYITSVCVEIAEVPFWKIDGDRERI